MGDAEKVLSKLVTKAIGRYSLIADGDRVMVAVSGGKDSTALAYELAVRRRWCKERYELLAVHIATDFCACCKRAELERRFAERGIPYVELSVPVIGRLKPGERMNCWWCSTQRRTELVKFAMKEGFGKLALGHHLDDIVETLLMNMMFKGEFSTMPPSMPYEKYPVTVIRPLALVEERQVIGYAEESGFRSAACTCRYGVDSKRKEVRARIAALTGGSSAVKRRIYESMSRVRAAYLA
jgi:tRNA 2-thiocytidine biosynthesis protein TtcA